MIASRLRENSRGKDFFVGDIQGFAKPLELLLGHVGFTPKQDRLIAVGDLIDRGPDSFQVLSLYGNEPWFYSVLGNHEEMALQCLGGDSSADDQRHWRDNGGEWIDDCATEQIVSTQSILGSLPSALEIPLPDGRLVGVVHAEVPRGHSWRSIASLDRDQVFGSRDEQSVEFRAIWGRERFLAARMLRRSAGEMHTDEALRDDVSRLLQPVPDIDLVIHGHSRCTDPNTPMQCANMIWLDTGVDLFAGSLTIYEPMSNRWWQIQRKHGHFSVFCEGEMETISTNYLQS